MINKIVDEEVQRYKEEWKEHLPIHYPVLMTIEDTARYEQEEIQDMINTLKPYWESIACRHVHSQLKEKSTDTSHNNICAEPLQKEPQINNTQIDHTGLTDKDIPKLRDQWFQRYEHLFEEPEPVLPPKREVEHQIPLIEDDKHYAYYMPRCPDYLKEQLRDKIDKYVAAGWWYPAPATQAAPMLCIPKKD